MHLKSLEINGFKSFAKKANLVFNTPITSIVGPNGSGKSNAAEAFKFVLGEQSIKSMRGKKGEDMIFNGGKDIPRANRASVKLVFSNLPNGAKGRGIARATDSSSLGIISGNEGRLFSIDFDEVSIERVVHRDGVNEYFLNGTQVRLKDILELLANANIGSSGHHIISQGEADRLLSSLPRERKDMIEDALGLKIYQYKKEESQKRLEKTAIHMKEVESLRREIAPHIRFLKKQVEKVERAVALREELAEKYKEYFAYETEYLKKEKEQISRDVNEPSAELEDLKKDLEKHRAILDLVEKQNKENSKTSELLELDAEMRKTRAEKDSCMREIGRLEGEMSYLKRTIEKKIRDANESNTKQIYLREVEQLSKGIDSKISVAMEAVSSENFNDVKSALAEIRKDFTEFLEHHKNTESLNIENEEAEILKITDTVKDFEFRLTTFAEVESGQNSRYIEIKAEIEKDKDKNVESEKAVLVIMSRQNELHTQIEAVRSRESRLKIEQDDYNRDIQEAIALIGRSAVSYDDFPLPMESAIENRHVQVERRRALEKIKIRLEEAGGAGGNEIIQEYKEAEERDAFFVKELEDLEKSIVALNMIIDELNDKLNKLFKDGISKINQEFNRFFMLMFGGGSASLEVVKEVKKKRRKIADDELSSLAEIVGEESEEEPEVEEGIDISVALPHKRTKGLMMLSGGERALTSIALLFAMSQVNPPPFIILDETDAALDEANSRKYGDMIEALSEHSQLILITHNRETMSRAGVIYGVTMDSGGYSKLLSIAFDVAQEMAK
ncbi:MAG: AAA family ATPase [bacterium]